MCMCTDHPVLCSEARCFGRFLFHGQSVVSKKAETLDIPAANHYTLSINMKYNFVHHLALHEA